MRTTRYRVAGAALAALLMTLVFAAGAGATPTSGLGDSGRIRRDALERRVR